MKLLTKVLNSFKPLTIFSKGSILNIWLGSETSGKLIQNRRKRDQNPAVMSLD